MTTHHTTAHQPDAPFTIPGNAFAALLMAAADTTKQYLRNRRELRRQRRQIHQLRGLDNRVLRDIGFDRSEVASVVTHGRHGR